jgi:predicted Fe-Mo cluster-binding NifX family protein
VFVDVENLSFEPIPNPAMSQGGGAGIQAAQFVVNHGANAVLTGNLGPNAFDVLQAAGVPGYLVAEGTVRKAVDAFRAGELQPMGTANVEAHAGMRRPNRAVGRAQRAAGPAAVRREAGNVNELAELRESLKNLRQQLAETMERIVELERQTGREKEE